MREILMWFIYDFSNYGNMSGCMIKGLVGYPIYGEKTYS